jgi:hypothetical protein
MNLLERIRRFWKSPSGPDHALTEEERDAQHPLNVYDEWSREVDDYVGDDFDPDEPRSNR